MTTKRSQSLKKTEKRNKKKLAAAAAALFLGLNSTTALVLASPVLVTRLKAAIEELHAPAYALADQATGKSPQRAATPQDDALITKAALGVVSTVIGTTFLLTGKGETFDRALGKAVDASRARTDRIATHETFAAFNRKVEANARDVVGVFRFNAVLDKKTCPRCEQLHGREWTNINDVPFPPRHVNCRCFVDFIPT